MADNEEKAPEKLSLEEIDLVKQIELTKKLQAGLLRTYLRRLEAGTISDTGLANLQRLLKENGWSLDPKQMPVDLKDMLTTHVSPEDLDDDDDVLPLRRKA